MPLPACFAVRKEEIPRRLRELSDEEFFEAGDALKREWGKIRTHELRLMIAWLDLEALRRWPPARKE